MATWSKLVEAADRFLAKSRFIFFFIPLTMACIDFFSQVQVGRSAGDENIQSSSSFFFFLFKPSSWICSQLCSAARRNIPPWIIFTLALLTSFSGVAMVNRGYRSPFCVATTSPSAESKPLGSAHFGGVEGFRSCSGVHSWFGGLWWAEGRSEWLRHFGTLFWPRSRAERLDFNEVQWTHRVFFNCSSFERISLEKL